MPPREAGPPQTSEKKNNNNNQNHNNNNENNNNNNNNSGLLSGARVWGFRFSDSACRRVWEQLQAEDVCAAHALVKS